MTPEMAQKSAMMKKRWFRELTLLVPTLTGKRFSNKTEDYGFFQPANLSHLDQLSIYVSDLEKSVDWYLKVSGLKHSRTCEIEPHPTKPNFTIRCSYLSANEHEECIVLMEQRDPDGNIVKPSTHGFFHTAFELEGPEFSALDYHEKAKKLLEEQNLGYINYGVARHNNTPPHGDGETGGNTAYYVYDPDYHNLEFFSGMDTVDNYQERYGDKKGSKR